MGALKLCCFLFLASTSLLETATAYPHTGMETTPLGGPFFGLDRTDLSKRGHGTIDPGTGCVGGAACTTTSDKSRVSDAAKKDAPLEEPKEVPPPQPKVEPVNPPGNLQCQPSPTKKYRHSHELRLLAIAQEFCNIYGASDNQDPDNLPVVKVFSARMWDYGLVADDWSVGFLANREIHKTDDVYNFKLELVEGCTPDGKLDIARPVPHHTCLDILHSAWRHCNNKGRGGSLVAGCIRYTIVTRF